MVSVARGMIPTESLDFFDLLAINLLKAKPPGTFLVRDSQGFPGSYGLAVKVETLPPGIQAKSG